MQTSTLRSLGLFLAAGSFAACTDDEPTALELAGPPAVVSLVSGNNQIGRQGTALPQPLVVLVRDANGNPVPAQEVAWSVTGGTLSAMVDSTGNDGRMSVTWTLPSTPGTYSATATVSAAGAVTFSARGTPTGTLVTFRYIDAGSYHGCGITTDEELLCWGYNGDGQLGIAPSEALSSPNLIPFEQRFRSVSGGRYHTCGLTLSGGVNCWGQDRDSRSIPGDPVSFQAVRAGLVHTCALSYSREIWCWGSNNECAVGRTSASPCPAGPVPAIVSSPVLIGTRYKILTVGGMHTCGVQEDGRAFCWGFAADGQTGTVGSGRIDTIPTPVNTALRFQTDPLVAPPHPDPDFPLPPGPFLAAGYAHTCAISTTGSTYCWGLGEKGQLGNGGTTMSRTPVAVTGPVFARITSGYAHSCGLTQAGVAYCWGDNALGQLGDGTTAQRSAPTPVSGELLFDYIKAGDLSTCGVTKTGVGYCWGDNEYGQLGNGTRNSSLVPVKIAFQP